MFQTEGGSVYSEVLSIDQRLIGGLPSTLGAHPFVLSGRLLMSSLRSNSLPIR